MLAGRYHRLNGKHFAFLQNFPFSFGAKIGNFRALVRFSAKPVPDQFAHHIKSVPLGARLDGLSDIPDKRPAFYSFYPQIKSFLGCFYKFFACSFAWPTGKVMAISV